jgi:hypothetical protein
MSFQHPNDVSVSTKCYGKEIVRLKESISSFQHPTPSCSGSSQTEHLSKTDQHLEELRKQLNSEMTDRKDTHEKYHRMCSKLKSLKNGAQARAAIGHFSFKRMKVKRSQILAAELFEEETTNNEILRQRMNSLEEELEKLRANGTTEILQKEAKRFRKVSDGR